MVDLGEQGSHIGDLPVPLLGVKLGTLGQLVHDLVVILLLIGEASLSQELWDVVDLISKSLILAVDLDIVVGAESVGQPLLVVGDLQLEHLVVVVYPVLVPGVGMGVGDQGILLDAEDFDDLIGRVVKITLTLHPIIEGRKLLALLVPLVEGVKDGVLPGDPRNPINHNFGDPALVDSSSNFKSLEDFQPRIPHPLGG